MDKFAEKILSVVGYIISIILIYVIQYIIGLYWGIPEVLNLLIFFVVGILAILIRIDPEKIKFLKWIPVFRSHFIQMDRVNTLIGKSAQGGTVKDAFSFFVGEILLILYSVFINILTLFIKLIWSLFTQNPMSYDFLPAFALLLGAVPVAYLLWVRSFLKDQKDISTARSQKQYGNAFKGSISYGLKLVIVSIAYWLWVGGELFLLFSNSTIFFAFWALFLIFAASFYGLLLLILTVGLIVVKPEK